GQKGESWIDKLLGAYQSPSGESISTALDLLLPILVLAMSYFLMSHALDYKSWGINAAVLRNPGDYQRPEDQKAVAEKMSKHPLFKLGYKTIGLSGTMSFYMAYFLFYLIAYLSSIGCALLAWKRPLRMALGLGAVLLANAIYDRVHDERVIYRDRSYFGILRVIEDRPEGFTGKDGKELPIRSTSLTHGTTLHGLNYHFPSAPVEIRSPYTGKTNVVPDLTRLATTYYHRDGPVGQVMEKLNWFPGLKSETKDERVSYWADNRLPASIIGNGVPGFGINFPMAQIVSAWSEPAYATIGLGTGTMASYSRPFQHMTFYEIDEHIRDFSLPPADRDTYFTYLQGAIKRGTKLEVVMGDARRTMTKETINENGTYYPKGYKFPTDRKAPLEWDTYTSYPKRESYYRAIEVDAFSSDAIPVHLITKEAIELYMDKLTPDGVLLVHTSNRHINLVRPVLKICEVAEWKDWNDRDGSGNPKVKTGLAWVICKDDDDGDREFNVENPSKNGHSGSEYVLVARHAKYLPPYSWTPEQVKTYEDLNIFFMVNNVNEPEFKQLNDKRLAEKKTKLSSMESSITFLTPGNINDARYQKTVDYFGYNIPPGTRTWTDDYSNVLSVFRWR
ncbi:MAG TPA: hypothetical protein VE988_00430, partial [Gemmataceae bacterium]|nr:hypothetical protein [Gemmataceae bacterium]